MLYSIWNYILYLLLIYTDVPSMQKIVASTDHDRWSVGKWCSFHRPWLCGFHAFPSRLTTCSVRYPFEAGWLRDALGPGNKHLPSHGFKPVTIGTTVQCAATRPPRPQPLSSFVRRTIVWCALLCYTTGLSLTSRVSSVHTRMWPTVPQNIIPLTSVY